MINAPSYPSNYQPLAPTAADQNWRGNPMSVFAKGGRVGCKPVSIKIPRPPHEMAKGGLAQDARRVAGAGVGGDELIIHINRQEFEQLRKEWGEPTINPHTGMPQFTPFYKQKWFAPVAALGAAALMATGIGAPIGAAILPAALAGETILGAALPSVLGNAIIGGGVGALTGGSKGALVGGLTGGLGTIAAPAISGALGSLFGSGAGAGAAEGAAGGGGWFSNLFGSSAPVDSVEAAARAGIGTEVLNASGDVVKAANAPAGGGLGGIFGSLAKPGVAIPLGLLAASALGNTSKPKMPTATAPAPTDPNMRRSLTITPLPRTRLGQDDIDYQNYGYGPQRRFFADNQIAGGGSSSVNAARGGAMPPQGGPLSQASRYVAGHGTGRSDSIDAKLSDGEYVMDAETVALLGDGSSKAGAQKLDQFRANIRKQKGRALSRGQISPNARKPEQYLMGGSVR